MTIYSPYTLLARRYRHRIPESQWMDAPSSLRAYVHVLGLGQAQLIGFPLALFADLVPLAEDWPEGERAEVERSDLPWRSAPQQCSSGDSANDR